MRQAYAADEPGAAVLVVEKGEVILREGYGVANIELNVPISPQTVFRIGSITKQFTAAGIMLLQEQGKLLIGDRVGKYLAWQLPSSEQTIRTVLEIERDLAPVVYSNNFESPLPEDGLAPRPRRYARMRVC